MENPKIENNSDNEIENIQKDELSRKVGYMYKKGLNRRNWKKRYFVLIGNELSYYENETNPKCLGTIYLNNTTLKNGSNKSERKSGRTHCFSVIPLKDDRIYYLSCDTEEEKEEWKQAIYLHSKMDDINLDEDKYPPFREGFLLKKGHKRRNWKQRWFILRKNVLCYYKSRNDEKKKKPLGVIPLLDTATQVARPGKNAFLFMINHPTRKVYYLASTDGNYMTWIHSIREASTKSNENIEPKQAFVSSLGKLDAAGEFKVSNIIMSKFSKVTQLISEDNPSVSYYCVLKDNLIYFLTDEKAFHPVNAFSLENCNIAKIRGENVVLLSYYKQTFAFECVSDHAAVFWLTQLNKAKKIAIKYNEELNLSNKNDRSSAIIPFVDKDRPLTLKELQIELIDLEDTQFFSDEENILEDLPQSEPTFIKKDRPVTMHELELDFDDMDESELSKRSSRLGSFHPQFKDRRRAVTLKQNDIEELKLQEGLDLSSFDDDVNPEDQKI